MTYNEALKIKNYLASELIVKPYLLKKAQQDLINQYLYPSHRSLIERRPYLVAPVAASTALLGGGIGALVAAHKYRRLAPALKGLIEHYERLKEYEPLVDALIYKIFGTVPKLPEFPPPEQFRKILFRKNILAGALLGAMLPFAYYGIKHLREGNK
jgi:hypothetical protein